MIAGTATKTCCIVDCPPFEEIRADLIGLCVKAPLLTQATYPELVRRFMEGALVAHQHKVNAYLVDTIELAAGTPSVGRRHGGHLDLPGGHRLHGDGHALPLPDGREPRPSRSSPRGG